MVRTPDGMRAIPAGISPLRCRMASQAGSDGEEGADGEVGELGAAVEEGELKEDGDACYPGAGALHQVGGGAGGAAGGQDVVDDQDALAGGEGVGQYLDGGGAVFELVILGQGDGWKHGAPHDREVRR